MNAETHNSANPPTANGVQTAKTKAPDQTAPTPAADTWTANWRATFFLVPSAAALLIVVLYAAPWDLAWLKIISANAIVVGILLAVVLWLATARWLTRLVAVHADPRTITELYERWQDLEAQLKVFEKSARGATPVRETATPDSTPGLAATTAGLQLRVGTLLLDSAMRDLNAVATTLPPPSAPLPDPGAAASPPPQDLIAIVRSRLQTVGELTASARDDIEKSLPVPAAQRVQSAINTLAEVTSILTQRISDEDIHGQITPAIQAVQDANASLKTMLQQVEDFNASTKPSNVTAAQSTTAVSDEELEIAIDRVRTHLAEVGKLFRTQGGLEAIAIGHELSGFPPGLYIAARRRLHRAEEALYYLAPDAELMSRAEYDLQCLEDSDIDSKAALKLQIQAALTFLQQSGAA